MSTAIKNVLLVDDDPRLLDIMETTLKQDDADVGVLTASNGTEALDLLATEEVVVVVTDINMPGITGLQLLTEIREYYPDIKVIIITGFGTPEIRKEAEQIGCIRFMDKPFDCKELKTIIGELVEKQESGFAGTLKQIHLIDLIQMCCQAGMSMAIKVMKGGSSGTIVIELGKIIHAFTGNLTGEPAFYEILSWPNGSFETLGAVYVNTPTIDKNSQFLLMEAARITDEKGTDVSEFDEFAEPDDDEAETGAIRQGPIRVLVVDDSAMMCRVIGEVLSADEMITIAGTARNGKEALEKIDSLKPDLITLDVNMPVMDGSTALKHIMIKTPCPVIIISNAGNQSLKNILEFLKLGAVDFIKKPSRDQEDGFRSRMIDQVKLAATANIGNLKRLKSMKAVAGQAKSLTGRKSAESLVVICAGAGGYPDLIRIVSMLPESLSSGIVVIQKIPFEFAPHVSGYLNDHSQVPVLPVSGTCGLLTGVCYVTTTDRHVSFKEGDSPLDKTIVEASDQPGGEGTLQKFLDSAIDGFNGRVMVVLLSGADWYTGDVLASACEKGARIICQRLTTSMVPAPLERVVGENLPHQQADAEEIARLITEWKST